jgi:hypothetical protein
LTELGPGRTFAAAPLSQFGPASGDELPQSLEVRIGLTPPLALSAISSGVLFLLLFAIISS